MLVVEAIISTPGHPYRTAFMGPSSNLASGDFIPAHVGGHGKVLIDPTGTGTFKRGTLVPSMDELYEAQANPTLFPNATLFYCIEDSVIEFLGSAAKVWYPTYTKNDAACQAHELYTPAVLVNTIPLLKKDGGFSDFYNDFAQMAQLADARIRNREAAIPAVEQLRIELQRMRGAA
jgi:hypothetical protein